MKNQPNNIISDAGHDVSQPEDKSNGMQQPTDKSDDVQQPIDEERYNNVTVDVIMSTVTPKGATIVFTDKNGEANDHKKYFWNLDDSKKVKLYNLTFLIYIKIRVHNKKNL